MSESQPPKPPSSDVWDPFSESKPPRRKDNTVKIVLIVLGTLGLVAVVVCGFIGNQFVKRLQQAGQNAVAWGDDFGRVPDDNLAERDEFISQFKDFHARVTDGTGFEGIDDAERAQVEAAIARLQPIVQASDDDKFSKLFDRGSFVAKVRKSNQLSQQGNLYFSSFTEKANDGSSFADVYCPATGRIILKGIRRDADTLVAQTYVCREQRYARCFFWYFKVSDSDGLRLYDWMSSSSLAPFSEFRAREFSASQRTDETPYDNYLKYDAQAIVDMDREAARAELLKQAGKQYPEQLRSSILSGLAQAAFAIDELELAISLAKRLETSGHKIPGARWIEVKALAALDRADEYDQAMARYVADFGDQPPCAYHRSVWYYEFDRVKESADAALDRLKILPEFFDGSLLEGANDEQMDRAAELIRKSPDPANDAIRIARELRDVEATTEANKLLSRIDISELKSAEAAGLRGGLAHDNGDFEKALTEYKTAMELGGDDNLDYIAGWSFAMKELGREEEAIRTSPDPATTFRTYAFGRTVITAETRARYCSALEGVEEPENEKARKRLKAWKPYAKATQLVNARRVEEAWQPLTEAWSAFDELAAGGQESEGQAEFLPPLRTSLLARVASRSGKVQEAFELLSKTNPQDIWTLCIECEAAANSKPLEDFTNAFRAAQPEAAEVKYFEGRLAAYRDDLPTARKLLREYLHAAAPKNPDDDVAPRRWAAQRWLVKDGVQNGSWDSLVSEFDPSDSAGYLNDLMLERNFHADRTRLLEALSEHKDFSRSEWLRLKADYFHQTWEWEKLVALHNDPIAKEESTEMDQQQLFEALLATKQFDRAQALLKHDDLSEYQGWYELQLAAAREDRDDVEKRLNESPYWAHALVEPWLPKFDDALEKYPPTIVLPTLAMSQCLLAKPVEISAESLTADLGDLGLVKPTRLGENGDVEFWALEFSNSSMLLLVGRDRYFERDAGSYSIPSEFTNQLNEHIGWFALIDQELEVVPTFKREEFVGQLAAALINGESKPDCVACGYGGEFFAFKPGMVDSLQKGQLDGFERWSVQLERRKKRPRETIETPMPKGTEALLDWSPAGVAVQLSCTVLTDEPDAAGRVQIQLKDSALCPPWLRDRKIAVSPNAIRTDKPQSD